MFEKKNSIWEEIVSSYTNNPRDVKTIPQKGAGRWFYVYVEKGNVYVDCAKNHLNSSTMKHRLKLKKEIIDNMLSLYYRKLKGESVWSEAKNITFHQVYWYGIFADITI